MNEDLPAVEYPNIQTLGDNVVSSCSPVFIIVVSSNRARIAKVV